MLVAGAMLISAWIGVSAQVGGSDAKNPLGKDPASIEAGRLLYASKCGGCHGAKGDGDRGPRLAAAKSVRLMSDQKLLATIREGIDGSEMPGYPLPELQLRQLVSYLRSLNANAIDQPPLGDVAAGQALFFGRGKCADCHMIGGRGGLIGPDLSNIGALRSVEEIRESVVNPNGYLEPGYLWATVVLRTGKQVAGMVKNRSNHSIQLLDRTGNFHLLLQREVRQVKVTQQSLMPTALLTEPELQNLLAFLGRRSFGQPVGTSVRREREEEIR